jgi:hypothetical protein
VWRKRDHSTRRPKTPVAEAAALSTARWNRRATHRPFHPSRLIATSTSVSATTYLATVLAPREQHRLSHSPRAHTTLSRPGARHRSSAHTRRWFARAPSPVKYRPVEVPDCWKMCYTIGTRVRYHLLRES